jgi:hypothetical protein
MSDEVKTLGKRAINRLIVGIAFLIIFGLVAGLALFLVGVPLSTDLGDFALGIENIASLEGLGQIAWWAISALIIAGIAIILVTKARFLFVFGKADKPADIPRRTFITILILGAIIMFLFFVANSLLSFFGTDLNAVDIVRIGEALASGDLQTLFVGLILAIIVGTIVVAVANRAGTFQKAEEDAGLPKKFKV